jgi:hypothetical protein
MAGGTPSGGWPAQHSSGGGDDENRTPLLIAIGVVAGILIVIVFFLLQGGGGDDDNGAGDNNDNNTNSSEQAASNGSAEATDYNDDIKTEFVSKCTAPAEEQGAGRTAEWCDCAWNQITGEVDFQVFADYEEAAATASENGDAAPALPEEITTAVSSCTDTGASA